MSIEHHVFDIEKINERIRHLSTTPKFEPEPDEPRFTVTHRIDDYDVTLLFVVRNGEMVFYDNKQIRIKPLR